MADNITYFVALPFVAADDGIAPGEPVECLSARAAILRAEYLSRREGIVGSIAFSRCGDLPARLRMPRCLRSSATRRMI